MGGYCYLQWVNTVSGNSGTAAVGRVYTSEVGDQFIRYHTLANFADQLNDPGYDVSGAGLFQNGWSNFGSGFHGVAFYKNKQGMVFIRGFCKGGSAGAGTVLFNMPAGYRPTAAVAFTCMCAGEVVQRVHVESNGNVTLGSTCPNVGWLNLSGINFSLY